MLDERDIISVFEAAQVECLNKVMGVKVAVFSRADVEKFSDDMRSAFLVKLRSIIHERVAQRDRNPPKLGGNYSDRLPYANYQGAGKEDPPPKEKTMVAGLVDHGGERVTHATGAERESPKGRGRFDLLPPHGILRLAQHFEAGATKYSPRNWEKGLPLARFIDSILRHVFVMLGGDRSEDHMAAIAWNAVCFLETEYRIGLGRLPASLADMPMTDPNRRRVEEERARILEEFERWNKDPNYVMTLLSEGRVQMGKQGGQV